MFYGEPKVGKTTIASKFPGALVLAFEKGYSAIPGIMAKPMNTWGDFRKVLIELKDPEVQEIFQTIVIDTADIAYSYCEKYICNRESDAKHDYQKISDLPFGQGYKMAQQEFDECIRKILQMNYGLVLISHSIDKTFKDESGSEYNQIIPTIDSRARLVCERTCDIIGYARTVETGEGRSVKLFLRGTPRFVAGSRFRYIPDFIDFSYDSLVEAIVQAIDKEAEINATNVTEKSNNIHVETPSYYFPELQKELQEIIETLVNRSSENVSKITEIVETHLGKGKKVTECTPEQAAIVDLIIFDLKKLM